MAFGDFHVIPAGLVELMTPDERSEYDRAFQAHVALQSPLDLALMTTPATREFRHIQLLNTLLVALVEHRLYSDGPCEHVGVPDPDNWDNGEAALDVLVHPNDLCHVEAGAPTLYKLFVTMPPRHGKSYLLSEHVAPWFLFRYPDWRVIFASYEADFAADWGRKCRNIVEEWGHLFGVKLDPSSSAGAKWELAGRRGGMTTAGAGGPITGKGGDILICDDPIKNQEEARSKVLRDNLWDWWHATFKTRRQPRVDQLGVAPIVLIHTRWHEDDLGGRLMEEEGDEWFHIDLPALQSEDPDELADTGIHSGSGNPLCRPAGAALCQALFSRVRLLKERAGNVAWFEALYQQRPSTEGTGAFKRSSFLYWRREGTERDPLYALTLRNGQVKHVSPESCYHFVTVDVADSEKEWADFTVYACWALTPEKELLLVDRFRKRLEDGHVEEFETFLASCKRQGAKVRVAGIENKTYGRTLVKTIIKRRIVPVKKFKADGDKMWRAQPAGEACDNGVLFWPAGAPWLSQWEDEHVKFPVTTHDDCVDTTAYAVHLLYTTGLSFTGRPADKQPVTLQEKVDARIDKIVKRRQRGAKRHPELGKVW